MGFNPVTGYYWLRDILGYGCKYNFILSERGIGKSYGIKLFLIEQSGTFMCLYRQAPDMIAAISEWIDPLVEQGYDAANFEFKGSAKDGVSLYYNGVIKGYFRYLTQVNHIKQEKFPDDLNWVWFDEFIPLAYKKLPGIESEGDAIRTIVKTIEHDTIRSRADKGLKPLRVLMVANPFTWNNPILGYFKIKPRYGIHKVGPDIVCELVEPLPDKKQGGKMTVDEFLGSDVSKTQQWAEQTAFVLEEWPKGLIPKMSIRMGDRYFGVYGGINRHYYIKAAKGHQWDAGQIRRLGTLEGLREDEDCLEAWRYLDSFKSMAYCGQLRFDSINTKFEFLNRLSS